MNPIAFIYTLVNRSETEEQQKGNEAQLLRVSKVEKEVYGSQPGLIIVEPAPCGLSSSIPASSLAKKIRLPSSFSCGT